MAVKIGSSPFLSSQMRYFLTMIPVLCLPASQIWSSYALRIRRPQSKTKVFANESLPGQKECLLLDKFDEWEG